jgi:cytochrome c
MRIKIFITVITVFVCFLTFSLANAAEKGTADEAKSLVAKAIDFIKANGKEKAFTEFNNKTGKFTDRDLYIFVVDFKGNVLAHGGNKSLVGINMLGLKDSEGNFFIKNMIQAAQTKGSTWSDYKWTNVVTKKIEPKSSFVQKIDDYLVACGIYK